MIRSTGIRPQANRTLARCALAGLAAFAGLLAFAASVAAPAAAAGADLDRQRALFTATFARVEAGDWSAFADLPPAGQALLQGYVLWPDYVAAYLRATIRTAPTADVERFLGTWDGLKPARELRYRYALELARRGDLAAYERIYAAHYARLADPTLDCLALQAGIASGNTDAIVDRARELWRVGSSQVDACDPVFAHLRERGQLRPADYRERYELAIDARSFTLARWLARSIDAAHVASAETWLDAQVRPEDFLLEHGGSAGDASLRAQLAYAAERLTFRDPDRAHQLWQRAAERQAFTDEQRWATERHIALWTARDKRPGAADRLAALPAGATDSEVLRWRARTALYTGDLPGVSAHIDAMPQDERENDEWRYWYAMALRDGGDKEASNEQLAALANDRSYYGFLAADELDRPYAFSHQGLDPDEQLITELEGLPELVRARELFFVGQDGRGRSEWDAAIEPMPAERKIQAAILAHRWAWHSRAIATVAMVSEYDDLVLRYPLAYQEVFDREATHASIPPTWALGIARSESLFMRDVRSGAGAVGIMQLLPSTGSELARRLRLPYAGTETLTEPDANIRLGAAYLGEMAERFGGNRILATAAYNAGPHRVEKWAPQQDPVDARIWIENIPYNETRSYVRRVLEAETIFYWRLTGDTRRLSDSFVAIQPAEAVHRVASDSR